MEGAILKSLIPELLSVDDMLLVIDSGGAVAEMYAGTYTRPTSPDSGA